MHVFHMAEPGRGPYWIFVPVLLVLLGVSALMVITVHGARNARFELSSEGLRLRGDLYGRLIPREQLVISGARRISAEDEDHLPRERHRALRPAEVAGVRGSSVSDLTTRSRSSVRSSLPG